MLLERYDSSIYNKVVYWFDVIKEELYRLDVKLWNVYNIDEIRLLC
jgi:hypothetical protein